MRRIPAIIVSILLILCLLAACGEKTPSGQEPAQTPDNAAQGSQEQTPEPQEPTPPPAPSVALRFDPHAYPDPNSDDRFNVLAYADNSEDTPVRATIKCRAIDKDGNALSVFDRFTGKYYEVYTAVIHVPAGAKDHPVAFALPEEFGYDFKTDKEMPEIDHIEAELTKTEAEATEDLKEHFSPGEPEIRSGHLYIYVKFDQEIADNYSSLYPSYALLGYSNGKLITVCCRNDYPYGTSSVSVSYAKEHNDSSMLVYHHIPRDPVDKWELYLGCTGGAR